jgi:hypothetical protein
VLEVGSALGEPSNTVTNQTGLILFPAITFTYGVPFNFDFSLASYTGALDGNGQASSVFVNTALITGFTVTDSNGNMVSNPSFSSASGAQYSVENGITDVSEPHTIAMFGSAICVWSVKYLLRRRSTVANRRSTRAFCNRFAQNGDIANNLHRS